MMYDRDWIAKRIPHQGTMCLLDGVASFDEERLVCIATSHAQADNPLRAHGRLGAATGIEYAAQAMAVHGALLAQGSEERPRAGFLASVRSVELHVERLDDVSGGLRIEAVRIHSEGNSILYQFTVHADQSGQLLLEGRAAVILDAEALAPGGREKYQEKNMKRALVTGGSGGIGAAVCRRLATDGLHVIVHANRNRDAAEKLTEEIRAAGGIAEVAVFDVTDADATKAALEALLEAGPIQVLVNNAGIHNDAVFPGMSAKQWHEVIDVSLHGFFNVTQPLMMPMIRTRWGRIINVSSIAAIAGNRGQVNYSAAKGALHSATKSLALEVASRGITVNAVAPGIIATDMSEGVFDEKMIQNMVPMKRVGKPEEVADLIAFLASEQAAYISGQIISINGAMI